MIQGRTVIGCYSKYFARLQSFEPGGTVYTGILWTALVVALLMLVPLNAHPAEEATTVVLTCASKTSSCKFGETASIKRTGKAAEAFKNASIVIRWRPEKEASYGKDKALEWTIPVGSVEAKTDLNIQFSFDESQRNSVSEVLSDYPKATIPLRAELRSDATVIASTDISLDVTPLYEARAWTLDVFKTTCRRGGKDQCGLGSEISLSVKRLPQWQDATKTESNALQLSLDGRILDGIAPDKPQCVESAGSSACAIVFRLVRDSTNAKSLAAWEPVIASLNGDATEMNVAIAANGRPAGKPYKVTLKIARSSPGFGFIICALALILVFCAAKFTGIVRDTSVATRYPYLFKVEKELNDQNYHYTSPASLAKLQMLLWTMVGFSSWIYLGWVCNDINTFNSTAFALMGISFATGIGAQLVDSTIDQDAENILKKWIDDLKFLVDANPRNIVAIQKHWDAPPRLLEDSRRSFWRNLIAGDNGNKDTQLHRVQILGFTVVLIAVFIGSVATALAMPTFSDNLLAMMGISGGSYVGFKFAQAKP